MVPGENCGKSVKKDVHLSVICRICGHSFSIMQVKRIFLKEHIDVRQGKKKPE